MRCLHIWTKCKCRDYVNNYYYYDLMISLVNMNIFSACYDTFRTMNHCYNYIIARVEQRYTSEMQKVQTKVRVVINRRRAGGGGETSPIFGGDDNNMR